MKLKDITGSIDTFLVDLTPIQQYVEVSTTEDFISKGYIVSNWVRGIWVKTSLDSNQMYPLCLNCNISEIYSVLMDLDIIEE